MTQYYLDTKVMLSHGLHKYQAIMKVIIRLGPLTADTRWRMPFLLLTRLPSNKLYLWTVEQSWLLRAEGVIYFAVERKYAELQQQFIPKRRFHSFLLMVLCTLLDKRDDRRTMLRPHVLGSAFDYR